MNLEQPSDTLQPGDYLLWYEIEKVLGKGGFGVTYLGRDTNLDQYVAIKEYMPAGYAVRDTASCIQPVAGDQSSTFEWGLDRFLKEAQILARFKHPNIVRVLSFFRDRNTAYMVMEYEQGESLEALLKRRRVLPEGELKQIAAPLLSGLEVMHNADYIHRDIKPPNIFVRRDGSPVILDFGSARQAVAGQAHQMTSLLSLGYSPFEQYDSSGTRQGPWSDIYALGGVLYRAISGDKPVDASMRIASRLRNEPDPMRSAVEVGQTRYSIGFLQAVDKALMVLETERPQSISAWRPMLMGLALGSTMPVSVAPPPAPTEPEEPTPPSSPATNENSGNTSLRGAAVGGTPAKAKSSWRSFITSLNDMGTQLGNNEKIKRPSGPLRAEPPTEPKVSSSSSLNALGKESQLIRPQRPRLSLIDQHLGEEEGPEQGETWTEPMTQMEFVWIPGGSFFMGSEKGEAGRRTDEGPVHQVEINGFWLAKYPVTWFQWKRVMGDPKGMYEHAKAEYPVERVLWEGTQLFIRNFMRMTGAKFRLRLPTEAEWEYAARAGTKTAFFFGDDPAFLGEFAWCVHNSNGQTKPVGQKRANPWGLYDIIGNVWEWTEDWYSEDYYNKSPISNPRGAAYGEIRVRRGGSWRSHPQACRVAHRNRVAVQTNSNALGFRMVKLDETP